MKCPPIKSGGKDRRGRGAGGGSGGPGHGDGQFPPCAQP
jgi:hypothetical protein